MKLSISNIAWSAEHDEDMYRFLCAEGFDGLEVAPTRLFAQNPYAHIKQAEEFARKLRTQYRLAVSSVQSLWFGRTENIFASEEDNAFLTAYTMDAIAFARALGSRNLVFGSPKNRNMPSPARLSDADAFFYRIGQAAYERGAVISFEPIPAYYGTNLINTTQEAIAFCRRLNCPGLKINYDLGTAIYNEESLDDLFLNLDLVHHIHISEPMLAAVQPRDIHKQLQVLKFSGYFSIEMKNLNDIALVKKIALYVRDLFE